MGGRLPDFNGGLVIIDEVHNLINGVKNQSKHATLIYNKLMKSDCKILALTGTPVFNFIWEWPFLGNLLKPGTFTRMIRNGVLDKEAFMTKFIVSEDGEITPKNPKMFAIKLRGIVSYFPGVSGGFYPEVIYEDPIQVRMTYKQNEIYWGVAKWEEFIRCQGAPSMSLLKTSPREYYKKNAEFIMASKYIMSRFYSNFYYPDEFRSSTSSESRDEVHHIGKVLKYMYKPTGEIANTKKYFVDKLYDYKLQSDKNKRDKGGMSKDKLKIFSRKIMKECEDDVKKNVVKEYKIGNIGWVDKKHFKNNKLTDLYSRKMMAVVTNVVLNWKSKHVLFSFFKTKAGVNMLHALFKMCGIRTEIYSGDISDTKRKKILKEFNAENNRYGDKIKILLVTEAGAEGINILEAQHMHILESSTREMKIQQAIGRVVRYKSHMVDGRKPMLKREQRVHIWRYWSVSDPETYTLKRTVTDKDGNTKIIEKIIVDKSTVDENLYKKGIYNVNSMQSFLELLKKSSVTAYDKSQDKGGRLKDYGVMPISTEMLNAYKISDKRYIDNYKKVTSIFDVEKIMSDIDDSTDEAE